MLFALFVLLLASAAGLLLLGFITKESLYSFAGFFLLFSLGNILLFNSLQYESGYVDFTHFQYINETGGNPAQDQNNILHNSTLTHTPAYSNYTDLSAHYFGLLLAVIGGFGFGITWVNYNKGGLNT